MTAQFPSLPSGAPAVPADIPEELPILPINSAILYPGMLLRLAVSGDMWIRLVDEASLSSRTIGVFGRTQPGENFDPLALAQTGTAAQILRLLRMPDSSVQLILQGQARIRIRQLRASEPYPTAQVEVFRDPPDPPVEVTGLARGALNSFQEVVRLNPDMPDEIAALAANISNPGTLADLIAANLDLKLEEQQAVLDMLNVTDRLQMVLGFLKRELEVLAIGQKAQEAMSRTQREYVLRQQLEAIRRELGETDGRDAELTELRERLEKLALPEEARKEAERELSRLERMPPGAAEYVVSRTYLDWLLTLPWNVSTPDNLDLLRARQVLDEDHYDLDRVKERIIEYLAVLKLKAGQEQMRMRGAILCFVGPPGVGKTSLGQSIARALGRKFVRVALGGVRDESDIRGFRRTYIGALPGRIIQGIQRGGSNNPVLMLDEVDKLSVGIQGDPAAALLELLDPDQNHAFVDRYLDIPFDMSRVLFICTANTTFTIPGPLLDRMEVLELAGYTESEKFAIAQRYLIPRQRLEQGLAEQGPPIEDAALRQLIQEYTREAGVRELERRIGALYRKMAARLAGGEPLPVSIRAGDLDELLGPPRFYYETILTQDEVGVATGLAWTPTGGDVLFVEASAVPGTGKLILTGQLGDVMKESAQAALTYARSRAQELGIPTDFVQNRDIHVHVPAGAVPKDGPSAGITMASALVSALTGQPAYKHVAMTGEINLRGNVLPIGGVKEKLLAAERAGVSTVLIPQRNEPDLRDVPEDTRSRLAIVPVEHMDEVLIRVLHPRKEAVAREGIVQPGD